MQVDIPENANITCLDYSMDMLEQAERRFNGYAHIKCIQSDVGNLQMDDESFDIVLSMNGFHAFPDKKSISGNMACFEIRRYFYCLFLCC